MNFAEEISHISDALIYVRSYAPNFPEEDRTDLSKESYRIIQQFNAIRPLAHGSTRRHWLDLAHQEIVATFESLPSDENKARRHIDYALDFIQRAVKNAPTQISFTVGPDGVVHHTRDDESSRSRQSNHDPSLRRPLPPLLQPMVRRVRPDPARI